MLNASRDSQKMLQVIQQGRVDFKLDFVDSLPCLSDAQAIGQHGNLLGLEAAVQLTPVQNNDNLSKCTTRSNCTSHPSSAPRGRCLRRQIACLSLLCVRFLHDPICNRAVSSRPTLRNFYETQPYLFRSQVHLH